MQMRWDFIDADTSAEVSTFGEPPAVEFNDIYLDLGSFFSDLAKPILEVVDGILTPVRPTVDILTEPIPVISDLAGEDIALVDLASAWGAPASSLPASSTRWIPSLTRSTSS